MDEKISTSRFAIQSTENNQREIAMELGRVCFYGDLKIPAVVRGVILLIHGFGSNRASPRNRYVANVLNQAGFATCLPDLLTPEEQEDTRLREAFGFHIGLLSERLVHMTDWMLHHLESTELSLPDGLPVGYFGASTGAAVALTAAADRPHAIQAVVSRGGRPDLVPEALSRVRAPTLLLVGEWDTPVLRLNREAYEHLAAAEKELTIIPGATHLFEEPGKLDQVAGHAIRWFDRLLK